MLFARKAVAALEGLDSFSTALADAQRNTRAAQVACALWREDAGSRIIAFRSVRDYLRGVVDEARRTGYTETMLGRRRPLPDLASTNRQRREMAERMALNAPIQGSAADIMKIAMLKVADRLEGFRSRMLLQVHDEIIVDLRPEEADEVKAIVTEEMGSAYELDVPLDVNVGTGASWQDAEH